MIIFKLIHCVISSDCVNIIKQLCVNHIIQSACKINVLRIVILWFSFLKKQVLNDKMYCTRFLLLQIEVYPVGMGEVICTAIGCSPLPNPTQCACFILRWTSLQLPTILDVDRLLGSLKAVKSCIFQYNLCLFYWLSPIDLQLNLVISFLVMLQIQVQLEQHVVIR